MPPKRTLLKSMLLLSSGIFLSRILGLIRDIVFAGRWGTSTAFAAFVIAFTLPNLLRALFAEGAFSAAFVPVFTARLQKEGIERAWQGAQRVISLLTLILALICVLTIAFSYLFQDLFTAKLGTKVLQLLTIIMPYALLICLASALGAVLNSLQRFTTQAFAPIILNLTFIFSALFVAPLWSPHPDEQIFVLALAVLLAGLLQLGAHLYSCRKSGLLFHFQIDLKTPEIRRITVLMAPILIGTGVAQLNGVLDKFLAGILGSAATASLYYSQRLVYLPVGLFGVSMATVCLPSMSRAWAAQNADELLLQLRQALRHALFLSIPATFFLLIFAQPLVQLMFQRGDFDADSTAATVWPLLFYLPGVPAFVCAKVAVTPFYARQDTRTPVKIAAVCLLLNLVLNLSLMWSLQQGGLALATTISSYLNVALLLFLLQRQMGSLQIGPILVSLIRNCIAASISAATAWWMWSFSNRYDMQPALLYDTLRLLFAWALGGLLYLAAAYALGAGEIQQLSKLIHRKTARH